MTNKEAIKRLGGLKNFLIQVAKIGCTAYLNKCYQYKEEPEWCPPCKANKILEEMGVKEW